MQLAGSIFIVAFTVLPAIYFASVGVLHEIKWRRRLGRYRLTKGIVVGEIEIDDYPHAEISYEIDGITKVFVASHCFEAPKIGKPVDVAINEDTGVVDHYSWVARYFFTIIPVVFALIWLFLGIEFFRNWGGF